MRYVKDIGSMVLSSFKKIITKCSLTFLDKTNETGIDIRLKGEFCEIQFLHDRGELSCIFINPLNNRRFLVNLVFEYLFPKERSFAISVNDSEQMQLNTYAKMINEMLQVVLIGDFSWSEDFDKLRS